VKGAYRLSGALPAFIAIFFLALPILLTIGQGGSKYVFLGLRLWPVALSAALGSLIFAGLLFWQFSMPAKPNRIAFWTLTLLAFIIFGVGELIWLIAVNACC
jgi:hypothetical protein